MCGLSNFISIITLLVVFVFAYLVYSRLYCEDYTKVENFELQSESDFKVKIDEIDDCDVSLLKNLGNLPNQRDKITFGVWNMFINNVGIAYGCDEYIILVKNGKMLTIVKNLNVIAEISEKMLNMDYYSNAFIILDDRIVPGATFYKNVQLYGSFIMKDGYISITSGRKHFISDMAFTIAKEVEHENDEIYKLTNVENFEWEDEFNDEFNYPTQGNPSAPPNDYHPIYTFNREIGENEVFGIQNDAVDFSLIRNKPKQTTRVKDLIKGMFVR